MLDIRNFKYPLLASALVIAGARFAMPGSPWFLTVLVMYLIIGVQQYAYSRCQFATTTGRYALLVFTTLIAVGIIANIHYFTVVCGGTDAAPILNNNDARRYWNEALYYANLGGEPFDIRGGLLGHFYGLIFCLSGPSITILSLLCMLLMAITLPVIQAIAYRVTDNKSAATWSMIAAGSVCYFLASGCIIIKDVWVICGTALCARAITDRSGVNFKWLFAGIVPISIARTNYLVFIAIGVLVMVLFTCRNKKLLFRFLAAILICIVTFAIFKFVNATLSVQFFNEPGTFATFSGIEPNQRAFFNIVGEDTASYTFFKRLMLMPISIVVQFLIPFPWNWMRDLHFGYSYFYAHIAYPWYIFGGILIYFLFTIRKNINRQLLALTLWGVICWVLPCYFTLGTVSRYGLPAVVMLSPAVGSTIYLCRNRLGFRIWMAIFGALMAAVLIACYQLQTGAMS